MKKKKESPKPIKLGQKEPQKNGSKKRRLTMNSETRELTLSNDNLHSAIEEFLHRLNLIGNDECVFAVSPSGALDHSYIHIKKEVSN